MVVSVAKATSADYYTGGEGGAHSAESYYLDAVSEGEPAGTWSGTGAQRLGLSGEVDAEDMTAVYSEFTNPITGESIGFRPANRRSVEDRLTEALAAEPDALPERVEEIRHRIESDVRTNPIGWDATFSVAKSVTVAHTAAHRAELAATRAGDMDRAHQFAAIRTGIESAIHDANTARIACADTLTVSRTGGAAGAPTQWVAAPGLVVASFFQHTSRTIDPQLHVHNPILNRAFTANGKARSLDGIDLRNQKHALGAVADRVLEEGLTRIGFEVELRPDGMARELTIVPTEVADLFSSRSRQMDAKVAELAHAAQERTGRDLTDLELYRLKDAIALSSRPSKHSHAPETVEEMLDRWEAMTVGEVGTGLDRVAETILTHLNRDGATPDAVDADGTADRVAQWSASGVLAEAVAACGQQQAAWRRSDLTLEIARRLPSLGGLDPKTTVEVLDRLTDLAINGPLVQQVSGHTDHDPTTADTTGLDDAAAGGDVARALQANSFIAPSARLYASSDTLLAEETLRRAGIERGGHHLEAAAVSGWLDEHTPTIGADQRAAVLGLASTDARMSVLIGPAGTGKSFTAGAFATAWGELTAQTGQPGRVIGLAVSQPATEVLRHDGVEHARNISQWFTVQDKLAEGSTHPGHTVWRLRPTDVVMIDEASMVATPDVERIQALATAAGARVVLTGDPRQLGAVEAGGVMDLMDGHAETYTLTDIRRFATGWEPAASLALRDGNPDALAEYDRHGRILGHESTEDATTAAATAAVADRLNGRSVVVVTGSNEQATAIATSVRNQLVELGLVQKDGVLLGLDGCTAGIGDLIAARQNDYDLGVINRHQYQVTAIGEDGSLTVVPADRDAPTIGIPDAAEAADLGGGAGDRPLVLPADYVGEHVQLGYASTVHAAQGLTVDAGHAVTDGSLEAAALYVALSRGRLRNTAHVGLNAPTVVDTRPAATTERGGEVRLDAANPKPTARVVLEGCLDRQTSNRAATVEAELDAERLSHLGLLSGRYEAVVRSACRERLDRHLDTLTTHGVLPEEVRGRLVADQGTEHLSRLLRAVEQAGQDPYQVLTDAVTDPRGFTGVDSVAQVLSHRITGGQPLPHPTTNSGTAPDTDTADTDHYAGLPGDIAPAMAEHLQGLNARISARETALGEQVAANPPRWALDALGPVPADEDARTDWVRRAGTVAGHREAIGWDHPEQAISTMPGVAATERRASHVAAWHALGQPEPALDETAMSEGRLRARIRAAEIERAWAPPHVDTALRAAETAREQARQGSAIARAHAENARTTGDTETADMYDREAAEHEETFALKDAAIGPLQVAADARSAWAASTVGTFAHEDRARIELQRRGISIGTEPDRTDTETWLAAERAARQVDDVHRLITETDLHNARPDGIEDIGVEDLAHLPEVTRDEEWTREFTTAQADPAKDMPNTADAAEPEATTGPADTAAPEAAGSSEVVEDPAVTTPDVDGTDDIHSAEAADRAVAGITSEIAAEHANTDQDQARDFHQLDDTILDEGQTTESTGSTAALVESVDEVADTATTAAMEEPTDAIDETAATTATATDVVDDQPVAEAASVREDGERGWGRSAAHVVLPAEVDAEEIEATAAVSSLALARAADRASQEASHVSEADRDDTAVAESPEQARHRREAADAYEATTGHAAGQAAAAEVADA